MRIDFYHLQKTSLEKALPSILERAYESGTRVLVKTDLAEHSDMLNSLLWTYRQDSFLPHGVEKDGKPEEQPIFITHKDNYNPNSATLCVLVDNTPAPLESNFERILYFFDGNNPQALATARTEWSRISHAGLECFYWKQNESGKWENKA